MKKRVFTIIIALSFAVNISANYSINYIYYLFPYSLPVTLTGIGITAGKVSGPSAAASSIEAENKEKAKKELARYMKRNHSMLVRDIILGHGRLITEWEAELNLTRKECENFESHLIDSEQQSWMLKALEGEIDLRDAEVFAMSFTMVLRDAISEERFRTIFKKKLVQEKAL